MAKEREIEIVATNRKAGRDYELFDRWEAGVVLTGTEIKSVRRRSVNLSDSFARIVRGEMVLYHCHISPYEQGNRFNVEPARARKLLLHRKEIDRLAGVLSQKRVTLVPLKLYQQHGLVKVELGVGRGKRVFEKRETIREREMDREIQQRLRIRQQRGR